MNTNDVINLFADPICEAVSFLGLPIYGKIWTYIISTTGAMFWLIIVGLLVWVIIETISIGSSENNFSPSFNRFVGATLYFFISWFIFFILDKFSFGLASCIRVPIVHPVSFISVKFILLSIGFWKY